MFVKQFVGACGGASLIKGYDLYGYRRGVREIVCSRLRRRKFYGKFGLYGSPPGRSFYSCKRNQNTLGALPQDPCRWLCWIRIDLRREPKINPYCAQNRSQGSRSASALSPHPLSRGGKGARMGWQLQIDSTALGVLGLAKTASRRP